MACLLHFKIFSDFRAQSKRIIENGQHFMSSEHYRHLLERMPERGMPELCYEHSLRYEGPADLVRNGFILPLDGGRRRGVLWPRRRAA